jgi:integrase
MARLQRPPVHLTAAKIRALKPEEVEYFQSDTEVPSFGVRVRPSGHKVYGVNKRPAGSAIVKRITLAPCEETTLEEARAKARQFIAELRRGVVPNARRRRRRSPAQQPRTATGDFSPESFGELALRYIAQECPLLARGKDTENVIRRSLLPQWGHRPRAGLRRADLTALLDPIVASGKTQAAHKLREVAIRIINWAIDRGEPGVEVNFLATPSRGGNRRRVGQLRRNRRDRVLSPDEIRAIWAAAEIVGRVAPDRARRDSGSPPAPGRRGGARPPRRRAPNPFGILVQLLLLLGQRRGEVSGMEWRELDFDRALWVIPVARYQKSDTDHAVPLPPAAVELLQRLPVVDDVYVFSTAPGTHISGYSKWFKELRQLAGVDNWTLHDLRRTARTEIAGLKNAAGQRVGADIAERVLGHVIGGVRGVYDRYTYLDEKREALELWAGRIREIVNPPPTNIVPLRQGAAA